MFEEPLGNSRPPKGQCYAFPYIVAHSKMCNRNRMMKISEIGVANNLLLNVSKVQFRV